MITFNEYQSAVLSIPTALETMGVALPTKSKEAGTIYCRQCNKGREMLADFKLSLHTWTIDGTPLETCLEAAAFGGFDAIEIRRSDIVECYERGMTKNDVIALLQQADIAVSVMGTEYGWWFTPPEETRRLFNVLRETCEIASAVGCEMVMSAPGQVTGSLESAIESTSVAGDIVAELDLKLALEFNSQHPIVNKTSVLQEIIGRAGRSNCGLLLDAYHLQRGPGIQTGLMGLQADELFAFQYSDMPSAPVPGVRRPVDRLVPGKGTIDWTFLLHRLSEIGFSGYLSYEAPNPIQWERSPYEVCKEGVDITNELISKASLELQKDYLDKETNT